MILDYPPHHLTQWSKSALYNMADLLGLVVKNYYIEPFRIEYFAALISARRGRIVDRMLAPHTVDFVNQDGHTCSALLEKVDAYGQYSS